MPELKNNDMCYTVTIQSTRFVRGRAVDYQKILAQGSDLKKLKDKFVPEGTETVSNTDTIAIYDTPNGRLHKKSRLLAEYPCTIIPNVVY